MEPCDGAVLLFSGSEKAQQFVDRDPYNTAGLIADYQVLGLVGLAWSGLPCYRLVRDIVFFQYHRQHAVSSNRST